jgi:anti-sigma B factor antagonist
MSLEKARSGNIYTISPDGHLDITSSSELENTILNIDDSIEKLIIDMKNVDYISSSGLRAVFVGHTKMAEKDADFVVANLNDENLEIFRMTGFLDRITVE